MRPTIRQAIARVAMGSAGLAALASASPGWAADVTWTGNAGTYAFSTDANWDTAAAPTAVDTAVFTSDGLSTGVTITGIANTAGSKSYGAIKIDSAPSFSIGSNTNAFTLLGVGGVAFTRTVDTDTDLTVANSIKLGAASLVFDIDGLDGSVSLSGPVVDGANGPGGIVKTGEGTLTLASTNTFTGGLTIQDGAISTVRIRAQDGTSGLGMGTSPVVLGGDSTVGELIYTGTGTDAREYTRGFTTGAAGGKFTNNSSNLPLTISTTAINGAGDFVIGGAGTTVIQSNLAMNGYLLKADAGTVTIASSGNTYTGETLVAEGTLAVAATGKLSNTDVYVAPGATLELDGNQSIADTAYLLIDLDTDENIAGLVNLNFAAGLAEHVGALQLGGTLYTAGTFNAALYPQYFTGTGNLIVGIPEPMSLAGLLVIPALLRRTRSRTL